MRDQTLQEIDGQDWGEPKHSSYVVAKCHQLRRVPIKNFTVEDLRLMIEQHIGLEHLVPLATEHLERNPLIAGDLYAGDLLESVKRVPDEFWSQHPGLRQRIDSIQQLAAVQEEPHD